MTAVTTIEPTTLIAAGAEGPLKPLLKWAGGKRWLLRHLHPIWQRHTGYRLVEPFCGGMAAALGLRPERALLNDINPHLINFYRWVQRSLEIDRRLLNDRGFYYDARSEFNRLIQAGDITTRRAAELFYYLNRTGFNGLCRFNRKGFYNVPFGSYRTITYAEDFFDYRPVLAAWQFETCSFEQLQLDQDDFIYADPPYDVEFRSYTQAGFSWEDQERLVAWLARHPGPVVLSNQATPRVMELYRQAGFQLETFLAPRKISCNGDRRPAVEVLATRNIDIHPSDL